MLDERLMVFESNPDFSDNSRGLWEYVHNNTDFKTCWIVKSRKILDTLKKNNIECVLRDTPEALKIMHNAKYLITSSFELAESKSKGQVHIAAWHGFPLKLIGFFESASATTDFSNLKIITTQSDIITCTSKLSQLTMSGMFSVDPRKVRITGFPRNDILFNSDGRNNLENITGLNLAQSKLIFYLPTMRRGLKNEGKQFNDNIFNYSDYDLQKLDDFLEENDAYIFVKLHFADNNYYAKSFFNLPKRIVFLDTDMLLDKMLTIYHLLNAFDALITDYSSVYVDYMLLNKPIVFSCPDIEIYKGDRGFIVDNPEFLMPGDIVNSQSELIKALQPIFEGLDTHKIDRNNRIKLFHSNIDGDSSKRLFEEMTKNNYIDASKEYANLFFPNYSPLYQYTLTGIADCYFDYGKGFSESEKREIRYSFENNQKVEFKIELPPETVNVRFDPDRSARWILSDVRIKNQDGNILPYHFVNAVEENDNIALVNDDSQIHILKTEDTKFLDISFEIKDSYVNIEDLYDTLHNLEKQIIDTKMQLDDMRQLNNNIVSSMSWKVTRPFRVIRRLFTRIIK